MRDNFISLLGIKTETKITDTKIIHTFSFGGDELEIEILPEDAKYWNDKQSDYCWGNTSYLEVKNDIDEYNRKINRDEAIDDLIK